ncbi:hypothetical protein BKH41_08020 [Helicobacter sp. 12S02232-10]|uniref:putative barnase/colicin E5 family endoribonuclease n=1 Tax=Helicobacter sp. 12S02232-10 TaxID=1476197 RepID=UPI000BA77C5E|nr:DUF3519 domain-containing protein [Helicobacter sp. 12S02232-10]PAF47217.1 hypothetical protein BKH41_08020 [Helicobacter sp. 12S02232-10]
MIKEIKKLSNATSYTKKYADELFRQARTKTGVSLIEPKDAIPIAEAKVFILRRVKEVDRVVEGHYKSAVAELQFLRSKIKPLEEFGRNYSNYYHRGKEAIDHLLRTKEGQVAGAFFKEGLGDIDLIWGNEKMGLKHILEKHPEMVEKIPRIVKDGELVKNGEFKTIVLNNYKLGLSKGWHNKGDNHWVITAYEDTRLSRSDLLPSNGVASRDVLPSNNLPRDFTEKTLTQQEEALKLNSEATSKTKLKESDFVSKKQEEILDPQTDPSKINAIINDPRFIEESIQKEATSIANDVSPTQDFVPLFKDTRERIRLQNLAENKTSIIFNDLEDIRADLPYLLKEQVEDVKFAEERFANGGRGVLFTNGTGTGKTLTGLGIIKRKLKAGGRNILILTPSTQKNSDWIKEAKLLNIDVSEIKTTKDFIYFFVVSGDKN